MVNRQFVKYEKLDPALTIALGDDDAKESTFVVSVDVTGPLSQEDAKAFRGLGVTASVGDSSMSAVLSQENVELLSEIDSVRLIKLSQRLPMRTLANPLDY